MKKSMVLVLLFSAAMLDAMGTTSQELSHDLQVHIDAESEKAAWKKNGWKMNKKGTCGPSSLGVTIDEARVAEEGEQYDGKPYMLIFARVPRSSYTEFVMRGTCRNCKKLGDIFIGIDFFNPELVKKNSDPDLRALFEVFRDHRKRAKVNWFDCDQDTVAIHFNEVPQAVSQSIWDGEEKNDNPHFYFFKQLYRNGVKISGASFLEKAEELTDDNMFYVALDELASALTKATIKK